MIRTDLDEQEKLVDQTFQMGGMFSTETIVDAILLDDKDYLAKARVVKGKLASERDRIIDEMRAAASKEEKAQILGRCKVPDSALEASKEEIDAEKQKMGSMV